MVLLVGVKKGSRNYFLVGLNWLLYEDIESFGGGEVGFFNCLVARSSIRYNLRLIGFWFLLFFIFG